MRIDPLHAGQTAAFLFFNLTKIVHFFNFFKQKTHFLLLRDCAQINFVGQQPAPLASNPIMPDHEWFPLSSSQADNNNNNNASNFSLSVYILGV